MDVCSICGKDRVFRLAINPDVRSAETLKLVPFAAGVWVCGRQKCLSSVIHAIITTTGRGPIIDFGIKVKA